MKKHFSFKYLLNLSIIFFFIYIIFVFNSCENFMSGGLFKENLEKDIAYAQAKSVSVLVMPEVGSGTTIPNGKQTVKVGYPFEISFTEASVYSFIRWIAVSADSEDNLIEVENAVIFDDAASPKTSVTVISDLENLRLLPLCTDRILVAGEPNPKYTPEGVSRDRSITVEFTKVPDLSCFFFAEMEIPEEADVLYNEEEKIWAYDFDGQRFLKNISITNADGYSIAEHFLQPKFNDSGKLLTIEADKTNLIQFGPGESLKTIVVTLSSDICDENGVKMTGNKSWRYQITQSTDEKASIIFKNNSSEGNLNAISKSYSIGQEIRISFTENADYQFVRWIYDSQILYIEDSYSSDTFIRVLEKTSESLPTEVRAVCVPRLRVLSFSPLTDSLKNSVSKNSQISIEFSQNLPEDEEGLLQLENIMITCAGNPVKSSFLKPSLIGNTVTFTADRENMLDISSGQTKTITVSIPSDFYYKLQDGVKVYYGGSGKSFDYKVNETTNEKTIVSFIVKNADSGTFTKAKGNDNSYSLGEIVELAFDLNPEYQFNGWKLFDEEGNELVADDSKSYCVNIEDCNSLSTRLFVNEESQGIKVVADTSKKLKMLSFLPSGEVNPKDSNIELSFNKSIAHECGGNEYLSKINVTLDGVNVDSSFENRFLSSDGRTITLENTKHLSVSSGNVKTVKVTLPSSLYYMDGEVKLTLDGDNVFSYLIDSSSNAKASVTFIQTSNAGTLSPASDSTHLYSLDSEVQLSFEPLSNYKFNFWTIWDEEGNAVPESKIMISESNSPSTKMYIYEAVSGVTVKANANEKFLVSQVTPSSSASVSKDSPLSITFNHPLSEECNLSKIKIYMDGMNVDSFFTSRSLSSDKKTVTIQNTKLLNVPADATKNLFVTVPASFYYEDGLVNITLDEEYSFTYTVNSSTTRKVKFHYSVPLAESGISTPNSGLEREYSVGDEISVSFVPSNGYEFTGWTVKTSEGEDIPESKIRISDRNSLSTQITVLDYCQDAVISANAYLVPVIQSVKLNGITDFFSVTQADCDSSLHFIFNKAMNQYSMTFASSGSLTITKSGNNSIHYENYFQGSWKGENEFVLSPKSSIRSLVPETEDQLSLSINFNANDKEITDKDTNVLFASAQVYNSLSINYLLTGRRENLPPVISDIHLYSTSDTEDYYYRELTNKNFNNWSNTSRANYPFGDFSQNHVSSVYITLSGYDTVSGIKEVQITETYMRDKSNSTVSQLSSTHTYASSSLISSVENEDGQTVNSYAIQYNFDGENTMEDGLFRLDIRLFDNAGNSSLSTYYVIKDTLDFLRYEDVNISTPIGEYVIPEYNSEKGIYECGFNFDLFDPGYRCFYSRGASSNYMTQRFLTLILYEEGEEGRVIFDADVGPQRYVQDLINESISEVRRNAEKDAVLLLRVKQENGITSELSIPFQKWTYIAGLTSYYIYISKAVGVFGTSEDDIIHVCYSSSPTPDSSGEDLIETDLSSTFSGTFTDNGIYYLFCSVITRLGNRGYNTYGVMIARPMCLSNPFAYYKGVQAPDYDDSIQFPEMTLPSDLTYEGGQIYYEANTGKATFNIGITYPDDDYDYSRYRYILRLDETRSQNYYGDCFADGENITVRTGTVKQVYFLAYDQTGTECGKSSVRELDLTTVDNQPPELNCGIISHYIYNDIDKYKLLFREWGYPDNNKAGPFDYDGGLNKTLISNAVIDLYLVPISYGVGLSKNDLQTGLFKKISVPLTDDYINQSGFTIPYDGIDFGSYYIYLYIEDNSPLHNWALYTLSQPLKHYVVNYQPEVSVDSENEQIEVSAISYTESLQRDSNFPRCMRNSSDFTQYIHADFANIKVLEDNDWSDSVSFSTNASQSSVARMADNEGNTTYATNLNQDHVWYYYADCSDYSGKFIRVNVNFTSGSWINDGFGKITFDIAHSQPLYIYPDYLLYKNTVNEIVCNNKNWIEGANGFQIFSDNPVFVHTMYCSRNLSEVLYMEKSDAAEEDLIREWESRAQETGIFSYNGTSSTSFTYGKNYLNKIPKSYYYITIAHFADGTTLMSEVRQK